MRRRTATASASTKARPHEDQRQSRPGAGTVDASLDTPSAGTRLAVAFGLEGDGWMRHANKWSVWTRFTVVSLVALAIWSREWIGIWCLIPIALSIVWMFTNPLFFKAPDSTRNWASRAVLGERIWVDRANADIPEAFRSATTANIANGLSSLGLPLLAYGLADLNFIATVAGILIVHMGKAWYMDRMVLMYLAMKDTKAEYAAWDY
jgi:hypothetical protein